MHLISKSLDYHINAYLDRWHTELAGRDWRCQIDVDDGQSRIDSGWTDGAQSRWAPTEWQFPIKLPQMLKSLLLLPARLRKMDKARLRVSFWWWTTTCLQHRRLSAMVSELRPSGNHFGTGKWRCGGFECMRRVGRCTRMFRGSNIVLPVFSLQIKKRI